MAIDDRLNDKNRRLIVRDKKSAINFLIDTGAEVSVIPPTQQQRRCPDKNNYLYAANRSTIKTYGEKTMFLNLGLRCQYSWKFIIADVSQAITFQLNSQPTTTQTHRRRHSSKLCSISTNKKVVSKLSYTKGYQPFYDLLREFEDITMKKSSVKKPQHFVTHHIVTKGPPVFSKPRRLSPEKLETAKAEIQLLLNAGICRPSRSPWASPLHMTKKKNGEWRPSGD
ncbi:uncharacterized protein LOC126755714 [Bactrocera neohumeralis]|uniref:uncharacterized protein LOC120770622 n=1 Tax=Bactrocera tryoni TaxID=59916 RepID=UPI001A9672DE|nr:uncharacterized protein LOC120770622 [Bactrocera tryoni]XP_050324416.1 uncharacterized protein LOC126755714 [Bactrocera neohumeralis]